MLGKTNPGWGKDTLKPVWWPHQITFSDVNNNPHPRRTDLLIIMQHFKEWKKGSWGHPAIMTMRVHVSVTTLMQQFFIQDCMFQDTTLDSVSPEHYNVAATRSLKVTQCVFVFLIVRETETWISSNFV